VGAVLASAPTSFRGLSRPGVFLGNPILSAEVVALEKQRHAKVVHHCDPASILRDPGFTPGRTGGAQWAEPSTRFRVFERGRHLDEPFHLQQLPPACGRRQMGLLVLADGLKGGMLASPDSEHEREWEEDQRVEERSEPGAIQGSCTSLPQDLS